MKSAAIVGGVSAIMTGIAIGVQSFLSGRSENMIGSLKTGLWTNFLGGVLAGGLILILFYIFGVDTKQVSRQACTIMLVSGALGITIIMGVSFSISRAGVTAGLAATMLGQFAFGLVADTLGLGGVEPIPLDYRRVIGLVIMAASIFLLLPRD